MATKLAELVGNDAGGVPSEWACVADEPAACASSIVGHMGSSTHARNTGTFSGDGGSFLCGAVTNTVTLFEEAATKSMRPSGFDASTPPERSSTHASPAKKSTAVVGTVPTDNRWGAPDELVSTSSPWLT